MVEICWPDPAARCTAGRTFRMGSPDEEDDPQGSNDERPEHLVTFARGFRIGVKEVTFAEYDVYALMKGLPRPDDSGWGRGERPVINVNWDEARKYAEWLSDWTREAYRLPTEAQWEYAARAGTQTRWSFGDEESKIGEYAWYPDNSHRRTQPVGKKKANPWGIHDVHGNVWEWTEDCWHEDYSGTPPGDGSAWERDGDCARRVSRGGSWNNKPRNLRSANRNRNNTDNRNNNIGFRLAQSACAANRPGPEPVCPWTCRAWCVGVHEPVSRSRKEGSAE